ncbi:MAG TPA: hypothetical protein DCS93_41380 [Microscillaceae bacterium]|nr:hypothetical protein [Microscillaceae bacterium]
MNKKALLYIIEDPAKINDVTLESLEDIAERFPYFHVAHVLLAKGSQEVEPVQAPNKIRRAAVYAYNRNLLRDLLSQEAKTDQASKNGKDEDGFEEEESITVENETISFFDSIGDKEEKTTLDTFPEKNQPNNTDQSASKEISLDFDENQDEFYAISLYNEGRVDEARQHFHKLILRYPDKKDYYMNQANLLMDNTYEFDESLAAKMPENTSSNQDEEPVTPVLEDSKEQAVEDDVSNEVEEDHTTTEDTRDDHSEETEDAQPSEETLAQVEAEEDKTNSEVTPQIEDKQEEQDEEPIEDQYAAFPADRLITNETDIDLSDKIVIDLRQELDVYGAMDLYNDGKVEEARAHFDKLILRYPDKKEYFLNQANLLFDNTYQFDESLKDKAYYLKPVSVKPEKNEDLQEQIQEVPVPGINDLGHPELEDSFDLLREVEPSVKKASKIDVEDLNEDLAIEYYKKGELDMAASVYQELMRKYPTRKEYFQTQYDLLTKNPSLFGIGIDDTPSTSVEKPSTLDEAITDSPKEETQSQDKEESPVVSEKTEDIQPDEDFYVEVKLPDDFIPYNPLLLEDPFELVRNEDYVVDAFDILRDKLTFNASPNVHMQDVVQPLEAVDLSEAEEMSSPVAEDIVSSEVQDEKRVEESSEAIAQAESLEAVIPTVEGESSTDDVAATEVDLFDQVRGWESEFLAGKPHASDDDDDLDLFELVRHWETEQIEGKVVNDEQVEDGSDAFEAVRVSETDQIEGKVVHDEQIADGFDAFEAVRVSETDQIEGKVVHDEQIADGFDAFEAVRGWETDQIEGKVVHDEQIADGFDAFDAVRVSETDQIEGKVVHDVQVEDGFDAFDAVRGWETDQVEGKVVHDAQIEEGFDAFEAVRVSETDQIEGKVVHDAQVEDGFDAFETVRVSEADQIEGKVVHDEQIADGFDAFEAVRGWETDQIEGKVVHDAQVEDGFDAFEAVRVSETDQIEGKVVHDAQVEDGFDAFEAVRGWETDQLAQNPKLEEEAPSIDEEAPEIAEPLIDSFPVVEEDENMNEGVAMDLFNEGRTDEAIAMYKQLIAKYPEKKGYYEGQLAIIADDTDLSSTTTDDSVDSASKVEETNEVEDESKPAEVVSNLVTKEREEEEKPDAIEPTIDLEVKTPIKEESKTSETTDTTDFFQSIDTEAYLEPETSKEVEQEVFEQKPILDDVQFEKANEVPENKESKVSESAAIFLFNQGRNEEAIDIYRQLMDQQPEREDYFLAQISILQNEPFIAEEVLPTETASDEQVEADADKTDGAGEDFISESTALILFNQGKVDEAIQVFERLKEQYPEKAAHFDSQIDILRS